VSGAAQNPPANMPRITPAVYYNDSAAGLAFLENAFGFKVMGRIFPSKSSIVSSSQISKVEAEAGSRR